MGNLTMEEVMCVRIGFTKFNIFTKTNFSNYDFNGVNKNYFYSDSR
jgi:hypothetical protein